MASKSLRGLLRCRPSAAFIKFNTFKQHRAISQGATSADVAKWLEEKFPGKGYGDKFRKVRIGGFHLYKMQYPVLIHYVEATHAIEIWDALHPAAGAAAAAGAAPEKPEVTADDFCDLAECETLPTEEGDCPDEKLIHIDTSVDDCYDFVKELVDKKTTQRGGVRVEPLMISRSWRGGKTTLLCKLFDKLQRGGYNPIFVTFNSSGRWAITRHADENLLDTLLRGIAWGLLKEDKRDVHKKKQYKVSEDTIVDYLTGKNVVLLVDELNALIQQGIPEKETLGIGTFLRQQFLDPKGRHLVFTTHLPRGSATKAVLGASTEGSDRQVKVVDPPRCEITGSHLDLCHKMNDKLGALTIGEMSYYSGIPSLIYSVKVLDFSINERFSKVGKPDANERIAKFFINEFFGGKHSECEEMRQFDYLTLCPERNEVEWILCYAKQMCQEYLDKQHGGFKKVSELLKDLECATGKVGGGEAWEKVVNIAIILRCLQGLYTGSWHQLLPVGDTAEKPRYVLIKDIPGEHKTPKEAVDWWQGEEPSQFPHVAVLIPRHTDFETADTLVVYKQSKDTKHTIHGFQQKAGREIPTSKFSAGKGRRAKGILMRGLAPDKGTAERSGWLLPDKKEVEEFVGASLKCVIPEGRFKR